MKKEEYKNILNILQKSYNAIINRDTAALRELSNHTIHTSSISQDEDAISVSIIIYSFSKIFERNYFEYKDWDKFYLSIKEDLKGAIKAIKNQNIPEYEKYIRAISNNIDKLDKKLRNYIQDVFEAAKVHKASRIHEHGISIGRTAQLLGISEWELMDYTGKTGIADVSLSKTMTLNKRIKLAREVFK
ncbi:MAG: hypothetical protein KJ623_00395 [Nanoarchaeota archaeon]|nr:hypothetical protein [Nanoarchaeota archaeon]MBU0962421.1 hypothetical protein [Nanoarchaeota archaeon]